MIRDDRGDISDRIKRKMGSQPPIRAEVPPGGDQGPASTERRQGRPAFSRTRNRARRQEYRDKMGGGAGVNFAELRALGEKIKKMRERQGMPPVDDSGGMNQTPPFDPGGMNQTPPFNPNGSPTLSGSAGGGSGPFNLPGGSPNNPYTLPPVSPGPIPGPGGSITGGPRPLPVVTDPPAGGPAISVEKPIDESGGLVDPEVMKRMQALGGPGMQRPGMAPWLTAGARFLPQ